MKEGEKKVLNVFLVLIISNFIISSYTHVSVHTNYRTICFLFPEEELKAYFFYTESVLFLQFVGTEKLVLGLKTKLNFIGTKNKFNPKKGT